MRPDRINHEKLLSGLAATEHHIRRLEVHDCLESTNARILSLSTDRAHGLAAISDEQTDGHGQCGRLWHSPPGGIYLSLGWRLLKRTARPALLTWAAAATVMNILHAYGLKNARVKQPNDIYCSGGKLAGILVETKMTDTLSFLTVTGIGINTRPAADRSRIADQPVTDLKSQGITIPHHQLVSSLLGGLSRSLHSWQWQSTSRIVKTYQSRHCRWHPQTVTPNG